LPFFAPAPRFCAKHVVSPASLTSFLHFLWTTSARLKGPNPWPLKRVFECHSKRPFALKAFSVASPAPPPPPISQFSKHPRTVSTFWFTYYDCSRWLTSSPLVLCPQTKRTFPPGTPVLPYVPSPRFCFFFFPFSSPRRPG